MDLMLDAEDGGGMSVLARFGCWMLLLAWISRYPIDEMSSHEEYIIVKYGCVLR